MTNDKLQKKRERALRANEELALTIAKSAEQERKRRNGRLMKLGIIAQQFIEAGDLTLLVRFEAAAKEQFDKRRVDRLDFDLDAPMNWFDRTRENSLLKKAEPTAVRAGASQSQPQAANPAQSVSSKPVATSPARPPSGANGSAPTVSASGGASTASTASA